MKRRVYRILSIMLVVGTIASACSWPYSHFYRDVISVPTLGSQFGLISYRGEIGLSYFAGFKGEYHRVHKEVGTEMTSREMW